MAPQDRPMPRARHAPLRRAALEAVADGGPRAHHSAPTGDRGAWCDLPEADVDRSSVPGRHRATLADANRAADILHRDGVHRLIYAGGEPLAHPDFVAMVAHAAGLGMAPGVVTGGAPLTPARIDALADVGLASAHVCIDAAAADAREDNRGLLGVCRRIRQANAHLRRRGISTAASVAVSRRVDLRVLPDLLRSLGFEGVTFSCPSITLAAPHLGHPAFRLVEYTEAELIKAFEAVRTLGREFPVSHSAASIEEMRRHLCGEAEPFGCIAGREVFHLDWHLDLDRCHDRGRPLCHVTGFDGSPRVTAAVRRGVAVHRSDRRDG